MNWSAHEIRNLRYRLGWSQAEFARNMKLSSDKIAAWEKGAAPPGEKERQALLAIYHQAESNADSTQRRPLAEVQMREQGLSQIHNFEILVSAKE